MSLVGPGPGVCGGPSPGPQGHRPLEFSTRKDTCRGGRLRSRGRCWEDRPGSEKGERHWVTCCPLVPHGLTDLHSLNSS